MMTLLSIRLVSLPVDVTVEKKIVPTVTAVPEPLIVQFLTVLLLASAINRIVAAVVELLLLSIVSVPSPSIVTLLAPFKSIRFVVIAPLMERVPLGLIVRLVHKPVGLFKTADAVSVVLPIIVTVIVLPV